MNKASGFEKVHDGGKVNLRRVSQSDKKYVE
jgi:hypothetical protein